MPFKEIQLTNNPCFQLGALDTMQYEGFYFEDFDITHAKAIPQQANAMDYGLYSLKYIESLAKRKTICEKVNVCYSNSIFFLGKIDYNYVLHLLQFDPNSDQVRFALKFSRHVLNRCRADVLAGVENFFMKYKNVGDLPLKPVQSPLKLPADLRYSTKNARVANMIPLCSTK